MNRRNFLLSSAAIALRNTISMPAVAQVETKTSEASLREMLRNDPLRPQYHLLPQAGSVGDPCAPRFFRGQYHAFFHGSYGGRGWAHAISSDLLHWRHMPIALSPTPESF